MFAPKVVKPQTKAAASSTSSLAHQRSVPVAHRPGYSSAEQVLFLQRTIGNQATLRYLTDRLSNSTAKEIEQHGPEARQAAREASPERADLTPPSFLQSSSPETSATVKAIQQATVENGSARPPTPAALSGAMAEVRMRDDASADHSARLLRAEAIAFGNQILFRHGRYDPQIEPGRALIAHELAHVAHQRQTGRFRPQRLVGGDVLSVQVTRTMAEAMTDEELSQQMNILRSHLQEEPNDAGAAQNLAVLESVAYIRQGTAGGTPAPVTNLQTTGADAFEPGIVQRDPEAGATSTPEPSQLPEPGQGPDADASRVSGPPSFDPLAVNLDNMTNEALNVETFRVDGWLSSNDASNPDFTAYQLLRGRLREERIRRARLGHIWLSQPARETPAALYMVSPGVTGRQQIIQVDLVQALAVPNQTPAGPIMNEAQYRAFLAGNSVMEVDHQTYQRDYASAYEGTRGGQNQGPEAASQPSSGQPPFTPVLAMYWPPVANPAQPSGIVVSHGTTQSGYEGFAGGIDLKVAGKVAGGAHQDFSRGLYGSTDVEVAQNAAEVRARQREEGGMQYVLQWEIDPRLLDVVDIRPGGVQRPLWDRFLAEPPKFAGPGSSVAGVPGFRTNEEYLGAYGVEERGIVFEEFLTRNGLQGCDIVIGELGGPTTHGKLELPGRVSDQVVIRSQRAVDVLNAQMRGEPPPGGAGPSGKPGRPGGGPGGIAVGAAAGGVIAILTTAGWMYFDAVEHPDWVRELEASGGHGVLTGASQVAVERAIVAGGARAAAGMSPEMLARVARGGGAGVISSGLEIYDIAQEPYQHSTAEVGVRVARAGGIGWTSAEVGTAAGAGALAVMFGTAAEGAAAGSVVPGWGTAIGFIVGLGAGALTYYVLNKALPGGRESWHGDTESLAAPRGP